MGAPRKSSIKAGIGGLSPFRTIQMIQCEKCLSLYWRTQEGENGGCPNCGNIAGAKSQDSSGTVGSTGATQATPDPQAKASEEVYSEEDTSKGIEYSGLLTEWTIGFRRWKLDNNVLYGEYQSSFAWGKGLLKADDMSEVECGFYAYHSVDEDGVFKHGFVNPLTNQRRTSGTTRYWHLVGVVRCKGDLYVYPDGFRAQYAEIVLLGFSEDWQYKDVLNFRAWAKREYGCAVVEENQLNKAALKYGSPIPESLIPKEEWEDDE